MPSPIFNVRVYGILIENNAVLVADELHNGREITKFPGGGLQFGEGTLDCLKREFIEEMSLGITIKKHFYTVDFFQASAFDTTQQVISIYYLVEKVSDGIIPVSEKKFNHETDEDGTQRLRWIKIEQLRADDFTFPIDQQVSRLLAEHYQGS